MRRRAFIALAGGLLLGCADRPPRRPTPPKKDRSLKRDMFSVRGIKDEWHEGPPIIDGLKRIGGVVECSQDETTGKFVVVYNPMRTNRDKIHKKIVEIGQEQGRQFDPIFDSR